MNAAQLKASILQQAIEGKLVPQLPEEGVVEQIGDAPTEVPFEIPLSWKWVTLEKCVFINPKITPRDDDIQATFLPMAAVSAGFVNRYSIEDKRSWGKIKNGFSRFENNDVLMAKITPCFQNRKSCIVTNLENGVGAGSTEFSVLRTKTVVTPDYILWFLKSKYFIDYGISKLKGTAGQQRVGTPSLKECLIPLPPLAEQKRIVAKIEELMPLVEEYGKAYDKLQELNDELPGKLKASILQEAIQGKLVPQLPEDGVVEQIGEAPAEVPFELPASWKWVPLVELTKDMADGPFGSNLKKEHYTDNKEVRIIQLSNIGENGWRNDNVKYTTYKHAETIARSKAKAGDIVIAKMMPAGRSVIVPELDNAYILSSDAVKAVVNTDLCINTYLNYAINSTIFKSQVYSNVQGTTRIRTSLTKLKNYLVPLPPLAEQKRIVAKLETLLKQVDLMIK